MCFLASPLPLPPQGRGLHTLRDGHREAPLPRLHRQGGITPHLPSPGLVSFCTLHLATRGRQNPVHPGAWRTGQGGEPASSGYSSLLSPSMLHPRRIGLSPPLITSYRSCVSRDSYRRDVAGCDVPLRVSSLQLPPVPAAAAAQPRSQVVPCQAPRSPLWSPSQRFRSPACPWLRLCQRLLLAGWIRTASTS